MKNNLQMEINKISNIFEKSFINDCDELILIPKINQFFRLEDVGTVLDLKCKFLEWVSRGCTKSCSTYWERYTTKRFNLYFNRKFTIDELGLIYTQLGNGVNRELCVKFIESDLDLELLKGEQDEK